MKSRDCSTNVSIYYQFIALALNVNYVVSSINSYIQEIDVLLQKTRSNGVITISSCDNGFHSSDLSQFLRAFAISEDELLALIWEISCPNRYALRGGAKARILFVVRLAQEKGFSIGIKLAGF